MSVRLQGRGEGNEATSEGPGGVAAAAADKAGDAAAVERFVAQAKAAPARLRLGGTVRHGHGTIRLRGAAPEAVVPEAPAAVDPVPAARHGHGTIRLRGAAPAAHEA